ncbi:MAG: DUF4446 family protein [Candidatus Nealsonbacteria bacterium]|nr:DUF4446 family protein [Candidatus Nealsonbacteria bacterium]
MFSKKKSKEPQNIKEILNSFKEMEAKFSKLEALVHGFENQSASVFQKTGIVRFNPFPGVGGNQSFSLCLLNKHNDGFLITSFYTREGSSVYGKPIKNGKSEHNLSDEEKEAIQVAINGSINKGK